MQVIKKAWINPLVGVLDRGEGQGIIMISRAGVF